LIVRLLVTRPEPDAGRTAAALRERGHVVIVAPLLRIEAIADAELGGEPWAAILVTSAKAAAAIAGHQCLPELSRLPVFAVGDRSADAMRGAGFDDVTSADGDALDLARLVAARRLKPPGPLLYLAGINRSGDLAGALGEHGFLVRTVAVYRAIIAPGLPRAAVAALAQGVDGVLHFSRRSAEAYVAAARRDGLLDPALKKPVHFCLSAQIGEPLAQAGGANIRIAPKPVEAALIGLISSAQHGLAR
jgi:uroporphyrinogen-III synthase